MYLKDRKWRKLTFSAVLLVIITIFFSQIVTQSSRPPPEKEQGGITLILPNPHAASINSILINGSNPSQDWDDCPWVNGSGTFNDPYRLENLTIDGDGTSNCITVANTNAYFRIWNCTVFNATNNNNGICVINSTNWIIINNFCTANSRGIKISESSKNGSIIGNNCSGGNIGISFGDLNNCSILGNNCTQNYYGIYFFSSNNCSIIYNNCSKNNYGIFGSNLANSSIIGNNCSLNSHGTLDISGPKNLTVESNTLDDLIVLNGNMQDILTLNITNDNLVNGRPVYYYKNQLSISVPIDAGQLLLGNCNSSRIEDIPNGTKGISVLYCSNNTLSNCSLEINVINSNNNTVERCNANITVSGTNNTLNGNTGWIIIQSGTNNTVQNNTCSGYGNGIYVKSSDSNIITGNNCSDNLGDGIYVESADYNQISNNTCLNNGDGIYLLDNADHNTISDNNCSNNNYRGIYLRSNSRFNTIIGNNCSLNYYGITLYGSDSNTIQQNWVFKNSWYGIQLSSDKNSVFENTLSKSYTNLVDEGNLNDIHDNTNITYPSVTRVSPVGEWGFLNEPILFTCSVSGGRAPMSFQWDFGDGTPIVTKQNTSHTFLTEGYVELSCTVIDADGDMARFYVHLMITPRSSLGIILLIFILATGVFVIGVGLSILKKRRSNTTI